MTEKDLVGTKSALKDALGRESFLRSELLTTQEKCSSLEVQLERKRLKKKEWKRRALEAEPKEAVNLGEGADAHGLLLVSEGARVDVRAPRRLLRLP